MQPLLIINTHQYWNPNQPDIKLLQGFVVAQAINAFIRDNGLAREVGSFIV